MRPNRARSGGFSSSRCQIGPIRARRPLSPAESVSRRRSGTVAARAWRRRGRLGRVVSGAAESLNHVVHTLGASLSNDQLGGWRRSFHLYSFSLHVNIAVAVATTFSYTYVMFLMRNCLAPSPLQSWICASQPQLPSSPVLC